MDCLLGALVVAISVGGFIMLLWLREQIVIHGGPDWLNQQDQEVEVLQLDAVIRNLFGNRVSRAFYAKRYNTSRMLPGVCIGNLNTSKLFCLFNYQDNIQQQQQQQQPFVQLNGDAGDEVVNDDAELDGDNVENNDVDNNEVHNAHVDDGGWNPDAIIEDLTWEKVRSQTFNDYKNIFNFSELCLLFLTYFAELYLLFLTYFVELCLLFLTYFSFLCF